MKTSIIVLSALFASCEAVKVNELSKFMPVELINEVDKEVNDTNYLEIGVNVRTELQGKLRNFLDGEGEAAAAPVLTDRIAEATRPPPGTSDMTKMPFTRQARHVEQRFTERKPYERFPAWILPGSEAILPKVSADLNYLDDEKDLKGNFHYKAIYDPSREPLTHKELLVQLAPISEDEMVQVESESNARQEVRAEVQNQLRSYLNREMRYPYDKFPATILPGSEAIMPKKSDKIDLFDGAITDDWHKNHRSAYNPRTHSYDNWSL